MLLCGAERLDHTSTLFYNLGILKVPYIVELRIGIIVLIAYQSLLPKYVQLFFSQHESVFCKAIIMIDRCGLNVLFPSLLLSYALCLSMGQPLC